MLTYKYKLKINNDSEEIKLNDFYISSDLSYMSGTTSDKYAIAKGDYVNIESSYYPKLIKLPVTYCESVKRNGYITVKKELDVSSVYFIDKYAELSNSYNVKYVVYNGNTYYQDTSNFTKLIFYIDGVNYQANADAESIIINDKAYIEDNKVTIDDIEYDITFDNKAKTVIFTDNAGYSFLKLDSWDISNVSFEFEYVKKIGIGNYNDLTIDYNSLKRYGYQPYIMYKGKKKNLKFLKDDEGNINGFGVVINGNNYYCKSLEESNVFDDEEDGYLFNVYSKNAYMKDDNGNSSITIDDNKYIISFDPVKVDTGGMVCIETEELNLPILINDTIIAKCDDVSKELILESDDDGRYVIFNGRRYSEIKNLFDTVEINGYEYRLSYSGDTEYPYIGMIATCTLDDDNVLYFKVNTLDDDGNVTGVRKVDKVDDAFEYSYTLYKEDDEVIYKIADEYIVHSYNGVSIGNSDYKILQKYEYEATNIEDGEGEDVLSYEYISVKQNETYKLIVSDTVGNNKILCDIDINIINYDGSAYRELVNEIINTLTTSTTCVLSKKENAFGTSELDEFSWVAGAINKSGCTSTYELSEIQDNIKILKYSIYTNLPVTLSRKSDYSMNQDDLVTLYHYDDKEEEYVNKMVDMEKDLYMPIIVGSNNDTQMVNSIEFILHFRTRDLDNNWQIYNDDDENDDGVSLTGNHNFSNWFITDYYTYNSVSKCIDEDDNVAIFNFNQKIKYSDLLGFLYFTTDDVKYEQKKLTNSFLRLTYYDSMNPRTQNMLGTSTVFFDMNRFYDVLYGEKEYSGFYKDVTKLQEQSDTLEIQYDYKVNVLSEFYRLIGVEDDMSYYLDAPNYRLDSKLIVNNPYLNTSGSSDGFNAYILKYFADKNVKQTIYVKFEFFHAGKGSRIPFIIPTSSDKNAISSWSQSLLDEMKEGYALDDIYQRLYVPIEISYNQDLKRFVYNISANNNYANAIVNGDKLTFNLFELKTKTSYSS